MGEFIDAGGGDNPLPVQPKVFTQEFFTNVIKKSIANGDLPADHKLAIIGAVDEKGVQAIVSIQVVDKPTAENRRLNIKVQAIVEHEWSGNNKAGAQLLFSVR